MRGGAAVAGGAALAVAACGTPGGQDPKAYVRSICTAYATYEANLTANGSTFTAAQTAARSDPVRIKAAALTFLGTQVTATAALQAAVGAQGRPRGRGGDAVRAGFVTAAAQAHAVFVRQQAAVGGAAPAPVSFFQVLDTARDQVAVAGQDLQTGIENVGQVGDQAINDAIGADQVCGGL